MTAKGLLDTSTLTGPLYNARPRAKGSGRRQGPGEFVCWRVDDARSEALPRARARPRETRSTGAGPHCLLTSPKVFVECMVDTAEPKRKTR
jgi:hypothetical protein